jgi:beta-N-acetylhexosaminidase
VFPSDTISAGPVSAGPISAGPISAGPVSAGPISGGPVSAGPIQPGTIPASTALNITGSDITGSDIAGVDITDPDYPSQEGTTPEVGLVAARRAVRASGPRRTLVRPVIIEVEPRENIAAGQFGWGLGPWAPPGSVHRVGSSGRPVNGSGETAGAGDDAVAGILAAAAGRSLVVAVRDAHRDQRTLALIHALLAARPDLVLVEMGLPFWHPPEGTSYLATYGASRASAHAAAELLGLGVAAMPREDT